MLKLEEVGSKVNVGAVAAWDLRGGTNPSLDLRYVGNDLQQGRSADATRTIVGPSKGTGWSIVLRDRFDLASTTGGKKRRDSGGHNTVSAGRK